MKERPSEYYSLKHGRTVTAHEIDFEYSRRLEGLPGEKHSLAPKPPTFLSGLKEHARKMRQMFAQPVKTRDRRYRD